VPFLYPCGSTFLLKARRIDKFFLARKYMVMLRNEPMKTFKDGSVITVIRVEVGE